MKNLKLLAILMLLPSSAFAQRDPSPVKRHPDLRRPDCCKVLSLGVDSLARKLGIINPHPFTALPNPVDFYRLNPPDQPIRPQSNGTLLIAEIPPGNPDHMPIWKPDSAVHYHLKIAGRRTVRR